MKKNWRLFLAALILGLGSSAAQAAGMLEVRGGAGLISANPHAFEDQVNSLSGGGLSLNKLQTFNADVFFNIPVSPIGIGIRHEWLNSSKGDGPDSWKLKANNLALLVDLRLIDTVFYLGPIVSVGYPWATLDFHSNTTSVNHQIDRDQLSYSGGLEAGLILGRFIVGSEAGYQSIKFKQKDSSSSSVSAKVDLSGFYGKAMVGLTFF